MKRNANLHMRREIAYHEAGHAVMFWLMQVPFTSIKIHKSGGGWVKQDDWDSIGHAFPKWVSDRRCSFQKRMIHILQAGLLAEAIYVYTWVDESSAVFDASEIKVWAEAAGVSENDTIEVNDRLRFETLRLLFFPDAWRAIDSLARVLFKRRKMGARA